MDEAWERAVETALEAQADASPSSPRSLTLDGTVKCAHGCMPSPLILERYQTLEHLSIANIGLSSLEKFPRLPNLHRLSLSDNRIAGGVEYLVSAGLESLRDLDLSNNRIQYLEDLTPLARLHLVSLDLYECPVTRIVDYRSKVFRLIKSLKYLDNMDVEENERPETDDDDDDEEDADGDEDDGDEEEDTGDGEVDGEERARRGLNIPGCNGVVDGIVDLDEESDADAEETDVGEAIRENGSHHHLANGFRVVPAGEEQVDEDEDEDEDDEYVEDDDEDDLGEEIDEEEAGEEEDVEAVLVHEIVESEEEEDGVEEDVDEDDEMNVEEEEDDEVPLVNEIDESEEEEDGVEEDVDEDDDMNVEIEEDDDDCDEGGEALTTARIAIATEGEIDGHDLGEEDENGEIGEENGDGVDEDEVK